MYESGWRALKSALFWGLIGAISITSVVEMSKWYPTTEVYLTTEVSRQTRPDETGSTDRTFYLVEHDFGYRVHNETFRLAERAANDQHPGSKCPFGVAATGSNRADDVHVRRQNGCARLAGGSR